MSAWQGGFGACGLRQKRVSSFEKLQFDACYIDRREAVAQKQRETGIRLKWFGPSEEARHQ